MRRQLAFARVGVSFGNSDGGVKFFPALGGHLPKRAFEGGGGSWTLKCSRFTEKKEPLFLGLFWEGGIDSLQKF